MYYCSYVQQCSSAVSSVCSVDGGMLYCYCTIKCAEHNQKNQFRECMLHPNANAGFVKVAAAANLLYVPGRLKHRIQLYTLDFDKPCPFTLHYSSLQYRKGMGKRAGVQNQQLCVALHTTGGLVNIVTGFSLVLLTEREVWYSHPGTPHSSRPNDVATRIFEDSFYALSLAS